MTPVCPACRSSIPLDAVWCGRCGLAVRPTCSVCGDALATGMDACLGCGEPLEGAAPPPLVVASEAPAAPVESHPAHRPREWVHVLVVGISAGIIVATGLLALELVGPERLLVRDDELEERSFPGLGFAVSHPAGWTVDTGRIDRLDAVTFTEDAARGFRVIRDEVTMERVRDEVEDLFRRRRPGYSKLSITDGVDLADRPALRHLFTDGGLVYEQWWIPREGGTFRVEFWAPTSEREEANEENGRILDTLRLT